MARFFTIGFVLVFMFLIQSCASNNTTEKEEVPPIKESINQSDTIKIDIEQQQLQIPINQLPTLKQYLSTSFDQDLELKQMRSWVIEKANNTTNVILGYGCGVKLCNTLLIQIKDSNIRELALSYGIFQDYKLSPNRTKAALLYGIEEDNIVRNYLKIVDLKELKIMRSESEEINSEFLDQEKWPIQDIYWIDNQTLSVTIPDILSSSIQSLKTWLASSQKPTKEITFNLSDNE